MDKKLVMPIGVGLAGLLASGLLAWAGSAGASEQSASSPLPSAQGAAPEQQQRALAPSVAVKPAVSWSFVAASITAGTRPALKYNVSVSMRGRRLYVQRLTRGLWHNLGQLRPSRTGSGSYVAGVVPMGALAYRLLLTDSRGHTISRVAHTLHSFGSVSLGAILHATPQTTLIGTQSFRYVWTLTGWMHRSVFNLPTTTCRTLSLRIAYLALSDGPGVATTATVTVVQLAGLTQRNIGSGLAVSLSRAISTAPFAVMLDNAPGQTFGDGSASCWSPNGR